MNAVSSSSTALQILVAEDDPTDRFLVEHGFRTFPHPHVLHFVADGLELLAHLEAADGGSRSDGFPDLILLDLNMPRCDGFQVLAALSEREAWAALPVHVVTTSDREEDRRRCLELGARGYFIKPTSVAGLRELTGRIAAMVGTEAVEGQRDPDDSGEDPR